MTRERRTKNKKIDFKIREDAQHKKTKNVQKKGFDKKNQRQIISQIITIIYMH